MDHSTKKYIWSQFGASIDMLKNAMDMCPDEHWNTETNFSYMAYHTLFFLDYYLTLDTASFRPPEPFDLAEFEDEMTDKRYSKDELNGYLMYCRSKCRKVLEDLPEDSSDIYWSNESGSRRFQILEMMLYNMRHVQHHAAQLNLLLRQQIDDAPLWIQRAADEVQ